MRGRDSPGREAPRYADRDSRPSRRSVLQAAAALVVSLGAAIALARSSGYVVVPATRRLVGMTSWQFVVFQHVARRMVAPDRPKDASIPDADAVDVAAFADAWVSRLDSGMRKDLSRFLAFVEQIAPLGCGCLARFTRLAPDEQDRVLESVRTSRIDVIRAGFEAVKALAFMGYYRDARTWSITGYDGPLVGRPAQGWQ